MSQIAKNPIIAGIQFKTVSVKKRPIHIAQIDGPEISIAFADTLHKDTMQPLGWYWSKRGTGDSRIATGADCYGTYFDSAEEAFVAALEA